MQDYKTKRLEEWKEKFGGEIDVWNGKLEEELKSFLEDSITEAIRIEREKVIDRFDKVVADFDVEKRWAGELLDKIIKIRASLLDD